MTTFQHTHCSKGKTIFIANRQSACKELATPKSMLIANSWIVLNVIRLILTTYAGCFKWKFPFLSWHQQLFAIKSPTNSQLFIHIAIAECVIVFVLSSILLSSLFIVYWPCWCLLLFYGDTVICDWLCEWPSVNYLLLWQLVVANRIASATNQLINTSAYRIPWYSLQLPHSCTAVKP